MFINNFLAYINMNTVIIPAHNEESTIGDVIDKVKDHADTIIVVDDGSTDDTFNEAINQNVRVLKHQINLGKGAALKTGCDYAYIHGAKNIVVIDADGQHDPKHIPSFFNKLENKDIVFGFRKQDRKMPSVLKFGNWFINQTFQVLYDINVKDSQSGYRGFTAPSYKKIRWNASDYYMETEMLINTSKHKLTYDMVPIETIYSDRYKGTTVLDGVKIVVKLVGGKFL